VSFGSTGIGGLSLSQNIVGAPASETTAGSAVADAVGAALALDGAEAVAVGVVGVDSGVLECVQPRTNARMSERFTEATVTRSWSR
jgi:hypothetical protein